MNLRMPYPFEFVGYASSWFLLMALCLVFAVAQVFPARLAYRDMTDESAPDLVRGRGSVAFRAFARDVKTGAMFAFICFAVGVWLL